MKTSVSFQQNLKKKKKTIYLLLFEGVPKCVLIHCLTLSNDNVLHNLLICTDDNLIPKNVGMVGCSTGIVSYTDVPLGLS